MEQHFAFQCVGRSVTVRCQDGDILATLRSNFANLLTDAVNTDLTYELLPAGDGSMRIVRRGSEFSAHATDLGDLIYQLEADLVIQLQLLRSDLFFLHSAVVTLDGMAHLLVGNSGAGKSTTCWGLQHHGFGYLSDELAPIDLSDMAVFPYPHALCMKAVPPPSYPVPSHAWLSPRGIHIPIDPASSGSHPVGSVFVVEYAPQYAKPEITDMSRAEAGARLYPNALNPLAHTADGLDAVTRIASAVPAFRLACADLGQTCATILATARDIKA